MDPATKSVELLRELEWVVIVYERIRLSLNEIVREPELSNLSACQLQVLRWAHEGIDQQEFADRAGLNYKQASERVRPLIEKKLLTSVPTPKDARKHRLLVTDDGRRLLSSIDSATEKALTSAAPSVITNKTLGSTIGALRHLSENLGKLAAPKRDRSHAVTLSAAEPSDVARPF
jgi:DNA-binding MarR family transcriptional regulator